MQIRNNNHQIAARALIHTQHGIFTAVFSINGLCGLVFPEKKKESSAADQPIINVNENINKNKAKIIVKWANITNQYLIDYFDKKRPVYAAPLDLSNGTKFQKLVWGELIKIKWGERTTYGKLAEKIGNLKAARAVGTACGANPVPIIIPCHRVVAANGKLGGYSGGIDWKIFLLQLES
ncbi:MAG: methylated-DNA--[protein]-cysteine S-methyltransferase [Verrucomicrobiia bacterium]